MVRLIGYIAAAIMIFFGVMFIWATFNPQGEPIWLVVGIISILIGFGIIFLLSKRAAAAKAGGNNVTLKIDLPGNVSMDTIKCKSCGGTLKSEDISMVAGAPVVTCPYCHTSYQLTEEPKW